MNFIDSPFFVILVFCAFLIFFALAYFFGRAFPRHIKVYESISKAFIFYGIVFLILDFILAAGGQHAWQDFFHNPSTLIFWIAAFLSPIVPFVFLSEKNFNDNDFGLFEYIIAFLVLLIILLFGTFLLIGLHDLYINITSFAD